jgi:TP901 family phage tail tape measure protein
MNVVLRVMASNKQEIAQIEQALRRVQNVQTSAARTMAATSSKLGGAGAFGGFFAGIERGFNSLEKFGKNLQWTGRQVEFRFTLPLVAAGLAATKFALDNERAMTNVRKVYGDLNTTSAETARDMKILKGIFESLSEIFGVQQKEVIDIAAAWAAAGAQGPALARATRNTLETMVLGEMDATEATQALITVQQQYGLSTKEVRGALAALNVVENESAIRLQDLIEGFVRGGASARSAGVDVKHMAGLLAVLVPALGSGATAGNALKTIFSRLLAPTKQSADALAEIGINIDEVSWNSKNGAQRLEEVAGAFQKLTPAQRAWASAQIAGRFHVARFDQIMRDVVNTQGEYQKALRNTSDDTKNLAIYQRELGIVLSSQPKAFDILKVQLQNALAKIMVPLIPAILNVAHAFVKLVQAFTNLSPHTQQLVMGFLALLAVTGPLFAYIGTTLTLIGRLGAGFSFLGRIIFVVAGWLFGFGKTAETEAAKMASAVTAAAGQMASAAGGVGQTWTVAMGTVQSSIVSVLNQILAAVQAMALDLERIIAQMSASMVQSTQAAGSMIVEDWAMVAAAVTNIMAGLPAEWGTVNAIMAGQSAAAAGTMLATFSMSAAGYKLTFNMIRANLEALAPAAKAAFAVNAAGVVELVAESEAAMAALPVAASASVVETQAVTTGAVGAIEAWTAAVVGRINMIFSGIPIFFSMVWNRVLAFFETLMAPFAAAGSAIGGAITSAFATASEFAALVWGRVLTFIETLAGPFARLGQILGAAITSAFQIASAVASGVWGLILTAIAALQPAFSAVGGALGAGMAAAFDAAVVVFSNPVTLIAAAVAAVAVLAIVFRKQLAQAFSWIPGFFHNVWSALPKSVQGAIQAVINILERGMEIVYDLLSYLNPFAHHSPSIVEQVIAGVDLIARKYASLSGIGNDLRGAISALKEFNDAAAMQGLDSKTIELKQNRTTVSENAPQMLPDFDKLAAVLPGLRADLARVNAEFQAQGSIVAALEQDLARVNAEYEQANAVLGQLEKTASAARTALDDAQAALEATANTPIKGMKAMDDQIFAVTMQQKKLRLEMLKMEEAGQAISNTQDRLAALNGELEMLNGKKIDLQMAGAGSDVLGPLNDRMRELENQRGTLETTTNAYEKLQKQLDDLQRRAEMLDLEKALKFDPLTKQIEDFTNKAKELPFETIMANLRKEQAEVDRLKKVWEDAQNAVDRQQQVVDALKERRDAVQATYDAEKEKLDQLGAAYDALEQQINDITSALSGMASAAQQAAQAAKEAGGGGGGMPGGGGSFDIPGGKGVKLGKEGGNLQSIADKWAKEASKAFGDFNPLKDLQQGLKDAWQSIVDWFSDAWDSIVGVFSGKSLNLDWAEMFRPITDFLKSIGIDVSAVSRTIGSELSKWGDMFSSLGDTFGNVLSDLKPIFDIILGAIKLFLINCRVLWEATWPVFKNTVVVVWNLILGVIQHALQMIRGVIEVFDGLLSADWHKVWDGISDIVGGAFNLVVDIVKGTLGLAYGIIKGIIEGIINVFKYLYDILVGHSIIPDLVNAIIDWFYKLAAPVEAAWNLVSDIITGAVEWFTGAVETGVSAVVGFMTSLPGKIISALAGFGSLLLGLGKDLLDGLLNGIRNGWTTVSGWLGTINQLIMNAVGNVGDALVSIGRDLIQGFLNGLKSMWGSVKDWVSSHFEDLLGTIGDVLGIGSPSKKTYEMGNWLMEGLTNGANDGYRRSGQRFRVLGSEVMNQFNAGMQSGAPVVDKTWNTFVNGMQVPEGWASVNSKKYKDGVKEMTDGMTQAMNSAFPEINNLFSSIGADADLEGLKKTLQDATTNVGTFQADLSQIITNGNPMLAQQIAALGPEAGAQLAAQLVSQGPDVQKSWETMIVTYNTAIEKAKADIRAAGPAFGFLTSAWATAANTQFGTTIDFAGITKGEVDAAAIAVAANPHVEQEAFKKGGAVKDAYKSALTMTGVTQEQIAGAQAIMLADSTLPEGARTLSGSAADKFQQALILAGATQTEVSTAALLFTQDTSIETAAGGASLRTSLKFLENLGIDGATKSKINAAAEEIKNDPTLPHAGLIKGGEVTDEYRNGLLWNGVNEDQLTLARAIFEHDNSLPASARVLSGSATDRYNEALNLAGVTTLQMIGAAGAITNSNLPGEADTKGHDTGWAFGTGFGRGIDDSAYIPIIAAQAVADRAIQAAKDKAGIESPSKVMREVGKYMSLGLAQGITRTTPEAERAARALANTITTTLKDGLKSKIVPNVQVDRVQVPKLPTTYRDVAKIPATITPIDSAVSGKKRNAAGMATSSGGSGGPTIIENHFHGDLVFPEVKDGDDAEAFIKHLERIS